MASEMIDSVLWRDLGKDRWGEVVRKHVANLDFDLSSHSTDLRTNVRDDLSSSLVLQQVSAQARSKLPQKASISLGGLGLGAPAPPAEPSGMEAMT